MDTTEVMGSGGAGAGTIGGSLGASDNRAVRTDGTGAYTAQGSDVVIDDSGNVGLNASTPTHSVSIPSTGTGLAVYNTADQTTNYERCKGSWESNTFVWRTEKGGTGTNRSLGLNAANATTATLGSNGVCTIAPGIGVTANVASLDITNGGVSWSATSGAQYHTRWQGTVNQASGTATWDGLFGNWTLTAVGSGGAHLARFQTGGTDRWKVDSNGSVTACAGTAVPAGGTAGLGLKMSTTSNLGVFFGSGAPTLAAAKGSLYLRTDGSGTSDRMYVNTDGSTTWTSVTTAA